MRDRKGEPVKDLTEGDFEIYEDGVKQDVGSMTPIFLPEPAAPANAAAPAAAAASASAAPSRDPAAGSLGGGAGRGRRQGAADDRARLRPADLRFAYAGVPRRDELPREQETWNNHMAVYGIDIKLIPLQNFTRDAR